MLGDSIQIAAGMPKSGHMANSHAKVAAAAIVAELSGWEINPAPMLTNTCYSFVDAKNVIHVASVHEYVRGREDLQDGGRFGRRVARRRTSSKAATPGTGHARSGPTASAKNLSANKAGPRAVLSRDGLLVRYGSQPVPVARAPSFVRKTPISRRSLRAPRAWRWNLRRYERLGCAATSRTQPRA